MGLKCKITGFWCTIVSKIRRRDQAELITPTYLVPRNSCSWSSNETVPFGYQRKTQFSSGFSWIAYFGRISNRTPRQPFFSLGGQRFCLKFGRKKAKIHTKLPFRLKFKQDSCVWRSDLYVCKNCLYTCNVLVRPLKCITTYVLM